MKSIVTVILMSWLAVLAACNSGHAEKPQTPDVVRDVGVYQVASAKVPDAIVALGTVHASETAQLAPQIMATVLSVNVHEGDTVRKGQVLAVIDAAQAQAGVERAKAAVAAAQQELAAAENDRSLAESTLKRYTTLFERRSVSPQEYDEVRARVQGATARAQAAASGKAQTEAALAQANTALEYARIRAPFDGIVTERRVDPGTMASPGVPMLTVEGTGKYRIEVAVDESSVKYVKMGVSVPVSVDAYPDQRIEGPVVQIVPAADPASRSFTVKVELPRLRLLRSGLSVRAMFPRGERDAVLIPRTAVIRRGALQGVYVVCSSELAELRYVTLGEINGDRIEVLSGLGTQDAVVQEPAERELGGKRVEVRR
jgi:RND family efflux transporter MFP subunit